MTTPIRCFALLLVGALAPAPALAQLTVPGTHPTIQAAIDASAPGGTITVSPGTYAENLDLGGKALTLESTGVPFETTIDGRGLGRVIGGLGSGFTKIEGFTVTRGAAANGAGIESTGAGAFVQLVHCVFSYNTATNHGGAVRTTQKIEVKECIFYGNSAGSQGGAVHADLGWDSNGGGRHIQNCTFFANDAPTGPGAWVSYGPLLPPYNDFHVESCVFWGHCGPGMQIGTNNAVAVGHCTVEGGFVGTGNDGNDPRFVSEKRFDLRLLPGSGAFGTGAAPAVPLPATDIAGCGPSGVTSRGAHDSRPIAVPATSLTTALQSNGCGDVIEVAAGTYTVPSSASVGAGAVLVAAPGATPRLQGSPLTASPGSLVEGFDIGSAYTAQPGSTTLRCTWDTVPSFTGGAVLDCTFDGTGTVEVGGSARIARCRFSGTAPVQLRATTGTPMVSDCIFEGGETAIETLFLSSLTVDRCTFTGFSSTVIDVTLLAQIRSSILWGNGGTSIGGPGSPVVTYSLVQGGYAGTGNINADPLFFDPQGGDYRLRFHSPAVDGGDPTDVPLAVDLLYRTRLADGDLDGTSVVDMGALESTVETVDDDGPADYATIQTAIDATTADIVALRDGTYFENISMQGKPVQLVGINGRNAVILDAQGLGSVVSCTSGETRSTILEELTMTGGSDTLSVGGGIHILDSSPTVIGCLVSGNISMGGAGGVFVEGAPSAPLFQACDFFDNSGKLGGGLGVRPNHGPGSLTLEDCTFAGNTALGGGGLFHEGGPVSITGCTIVDNDAPYGSGIFIGGQPSTSAALENSIVWGNTGSTAPVHDDSPVQVAYSIVQGGYTGTGNVDSDPRFLDAPNGDYRLRPGSPAVDAGDPSLTGAGDVDALGRPRVSDGDFDGFARVDMGALESVFLSVDDDGPADYSNIQPALNSSTQTDAILVRAGSYGPVVFDREVLVLSESGPAVTHINAGANRIVRFVSGAGVRAALEGFELAFSPKGAITIDSSSPAIRNCVIRHNYASQGAGVRILSTLASAPARIESSFITDNIAEEGAGAVLVKTGACEIVNSVLIGNLSIHGAATLASEASATLSLFSSTVFGHTDYQPDSFECHVFDGTIRNSILWSPRGTNFIDNSVGVSNSILRNVGGLPADDVFVDTLSGDLRLACGSPAIDAGDANGALLTPTDIAGRPRITDGDLDGNPVLDIGAYEAVAVLVDDDGPGVTDIQAALDSTPAPDSIVVADGTYAGFTVLGSAEIKSQNGSESTFIAGGGGPQLVHVAPGANVSIEGFTIDSGGAAQGLLVDGATVELRDLVVQNNVSPAGGGGMRLSGASVATVDDCIFQYNTALHGGGVSVEGGSTATVRASTMRENEATGLEGGGGLYVSGSTVSLERSWLLANLCSDDTDGSQSSSGGLLAVAGSDVDLWSTVVAGNEALFAGGVGLVDSDVMLEGCSVGGNRARDSVGGMITGSGATATVQNSILADNEDSGTTFFDHLDYQGGSTMFTYSNVGDGLEPGAGNISADPRFVNTAELDLRLRASSPCLDAGNPDTTGLTATDVRGAPRVAQGTDPALGGSVRVNMGAHESVTRVVNPDQGFGTTVQAAVDAAHPIAGVIFASRASGAPFHEGVVVLDKDIVLYGVDEVLLPDKRGSIDPSGIGSVVTVTGAGPNGDTRVQGFALTNGGGSGVRIREGARTTISGCEIFDNFEANWGGGIRVGTAHATVIDCIVRDNRSGEAGGGVWVKDGSADLINTLIVNNTAAATGSAVRLDPFGATAPVVSMVNCTLSGNGRAPQVIHALAGTELHARNTIVWGNSGSSLAGNGLITVEYCDIEGGYTGTGNLDVDPRFIAPRAGNYRLRRHSLCIDAGDNAALPSAVRMDLDGARRYINVLDVLDKGAGDAPIVDLGAYEVPALPSGPTRAGGIPGSVMIP